MTQEETSALKKKEPHPSSYDAKKWLGEYLTKDVHVAFRWQEAFASCAAGGNRSAEIMGETLRRALHGLPVSDRYILGLAWFLRDLEERIHNPTSEQLNKAIKESLH